MVTSNKHNGIADIPIPDHLISCHFQILRVRLDIGEDNGPPLKAGLTVVEKADARRFTKNPQTY